MTEYWKSVPDKVEKNLAYREDLIRMASEDQAVREELWIACSRDLLFYVNAFCWTYDPRRGVGVLPFVTYDFQNKSMTMIEEAIKEGEDLVIKKSRDMGASWMLLTVFEWLWHFKAGQSFLLVSRNEDYVDKAGNPKSLFWKIDFIHKHLPAWIMPNISRTKLRLTNEDNGSSIDGESTTGDVARGDRRTAIGLDEFAAFEVDSSYRALSSTRDATRCRIFNSTPAGSGNAFYDIAHNKEFKQLMLHWTIHPRKADGLYYTGDKPRSPWYDNECRRCAHAQEIAQELDIDFTGSDYQFFDAKVISNLLMSAGRPPLHVGEIEFDADSCIPTHFAKSNKGRLRLWMNPTPTMQMDPDRLYAIGVDIATGTGSSNSVLSVGDCRTGEKIMEFVSSKTRPEELARICVAIAKWCTGSNNQGAFIVWEAPGPGRNFGDAVIDTGFRNFYYKESDQKISNPRSRIPGWWPTKDNKRSLYSEYREGLTSGAFLNPSKEAISECREIVYTANGWIQHSKTGSSVDPSGARENHGDRPTADALLWKGMKMRSLPVAKKEESVTEGSFMYRRMVVEQRNKSQGIW